MNSFINVDICDFVRANIQEFSKALIIDKLSDY